MENRKKQIIFLEPWPTVMIYKIAKLLKEKGYETISIRILEGKSLDDLFKQGFNKIISFNLKFFKLNLKNVPKILISILKRTKYLFKALFEILKLRPYVIFTRSLPNWPCALTKILFKKYPMIYFPYDIRANDSDIKRNGVNKDSSFEAKAEKFCFENAEGIMHKGDPNELKNLHKIFENLNICPSQLSFLPYCSKDFIAPLNKDKLSKKDGEIHVVNAASVGSISPALFLLDYAREFIKHKIHFHLYLKPNTLTKEEIIKSSKEVYMPVLDSKYFHLETPLNPKELVKDLSRYDYGLLILNTTEKTEIDNSAFQYLAANKISSYLEAGIPFFCSEKFRFVDKLMKKYGIDMNLNSPEDVKNLRKRIKKQNYKQLEKKVLKARQDFLMEKHFPRLEKFVKEVVKREKKYF